MSIQEGESLGSWGPRPVYTESMRSNGQTGRADGHALGGGKDLECRRCRVLCERVVHPVECVRHGCSYTYAFTQEAVSYTHLRAHETDSYLVCRLLLEKQNKHQQKT